MWIGHQEYVIWQRLNIYGYVWGQVYKNTVDLNNEIIWYVSEKVSQFRQNFNEKFNRREDVCKAARGGHLADNNECHNWYLYDQNWIMNAKFSVLYKVLFL